ncbi:MAG: putative pyridoxamine 5-phosphate oxidase [Firmicutes bacterium]|nr:putative pyridoxamine 5-phosphate oxidase [Bacillota bacterium]
MQRGELRRTDRQMTEAESWTFLTSSFSGCIGTVDADGWPYVVPQLFVIHDGKLYFHTTAANGHTRSNILSNPKVCVEADEPGVIFPYGEKAPCETSVGFESVILFGTCEIVTDQAQKVLFFERFMAKYADAAWERPPVWPLLDATTVYEITVARLTGKRRPVVIADKWKHMFETPCR